MSSETNKALARRIVEEMWNTKNLKVVDEVYSAEFGGGHEAIKQFVTASLAAFPDLQITIQDQIAENDLVATRYVDARHTRGRVCELFANGKTVYSYRD